MATLGTPTNENGKGYQRWYPQVGDIRPEGCEYMINPGNWVQSEFKNGERIEECHVRNEQYRIPSQYTPPAGWYCVPDEDVAIDGDVYSEDMRPVWLNVGESVKSARSRAMPDGGWVLRREPVAFPETTARNVAAVIGPSQSFLEVAGKSESAEGVMEQVCLKTEAGTDQIDTVDAPTATAPVAWQFRKQPMERVVDHYRLLTHLKDTIDEGDVFIEDFQPGERYKYHAAAKIGNVFNEALHITHLRPVYAPLPSRLEDVPDGRVIEIKGNRRLYFKGCGLFWIIWGQVTINTNNPMLSRDVVKDMQVDLESDFTIADYVAELGEVK